MNLFEEDGRYEPDSLIAGYKKGCLVRGIKLAPGQGLLKRGTLLARNEDGLGIMFGEKADMDDAAAQKQAEIQEDQGTADTEAIVPSGILTDDVDTGSDESDDPVVASEYITGTFNPDAVIAKKGTEVREFTEQLRRLGIFF